MSLICLCVVKNVRKQSEIDLWKTGDGRQGTVLCLDTAGRRLPTWGRPTMPKPTPSPAPAATLSGTKDRCGD